MARGNISLFTLLIIAHVTFTIDKEVPSFIELPSPIQYFSNESSLELRCKAWPSTAKVQFFVSSQKIRSNTLELNLIDHNIGELSSSGSLLISRLNHLDNFQDQNIHCLISTDFGAVLSRPFRVTGARISDFVEDLATQSQTSQKSFLRGNVAIIDCRRPESYPKARVTFQFNNIEIKEARKYRMIEWPDCKKVSLLIHPVEQSDQGQYTCTATNIITKQTKLSPHIINLSIEIPRTSISPSIIMPMSGRSSGPQQILAREGTNVTLFCVMRGAPPPQTQIYNYNNDLTSNRRYSVDNDFGLLKIMGLKVRDSGSYMCSDKFLTSSAVLQVIETLKISIRPVNVTLDSLHGSVHFECTSSKSSIRVQWLFNGQSLPSLFNGSLHIQPVMVIDLGIYQCVAQDDEEWASATTILSMKSYNLSSQLSLIIEGVVSPPLTENIDYQLQVLSIPVAKKIFDNVAVYVSWKVNIKRNMSERVYFVLQYIYKGLEHSWSDVITIQEKIYVPYHYISDIYLAPQHSYSFRVHVFFSNGHTITSPWSAEVDFINVGDIAPVIEEASMKSYKSLFLRWSYSASETWPVTLFRIIIRPLLNTTMTLKRFGTYIGKDVMFPTNSTTIDDLERGGTYQMKIYGINERVESRTITKSSEPRMITYKTMTSYSRTFFSGLLDSWNNNKLLYGNLLVLTGVLIGLLLLLLLLCICRQRRLRNNKDTKKPHILPYGYKDVYQSNTTHDNIATLQIPGRMSTHSHQPPLQQFNNNSACINQQNNDTFSRERRAGSCLAIDIGSPRRDIHGEKYMYGGEMEEIQQACQVYSTLPQGHHNSYNNRSNPKYQQLLYQQRHVNTDNIGRENIISDFNGDRRDRTNQALDMSSMNTTASMHQQRSKTNVYHSKPNLMSQQIMILKASQQSLGTYGKYARTNIHNYPDHAEPPSIRDTTRPWTYGKDQMMLDGSRRSMSPNVHSIQQQIPQQYASNPSVVGLDNIPPSFGNCSQRNLHNVQCRRSGCCNDDRTDQMYKCLQRTSIHSETNASLKNNLNNIQGILTDVNRKHLHEGLVKNMAGSTLHTTPTLDPHRNLSHNYGRDQDLSYVWPRHEPSSNLPYNNHSYNQASSQHHALSLSDSHSESNVAGANIEPPFQYSTHYDSSGFNDNDAAHYDSLSIENVPRLNEYELRTKDDQDKSNILLYNIDYYSSPLHCNRPCRSPTLL